MGFVISTLKLLHILIAVSFGNARQSDFQNVNFLTLVVYPAFIRFLNFSKNQLALDGNLQMWVDAEDSLELW